MISSPTEEKLITPVLEDGLLHPQSPNSKDEEVLAPGVVECSAAVDISNTPRPLRGDESAALGVLEPNTIEDTPPPSYVPADGDPGALVVIPDAGDTSQCGHVMSKGSLVTAAVGGLGGYVIATPATLNVLALIGFGPVGVAKLSLAAGAQSTIGNVVAGSGFAACQSVAATAIVPAVVPLIFAAGCALVGFGGHYVVKKGSEKMSTRD